MSKPSTTKAASADQPTADDAPAPAHTSAEVASIASELLALEPIDIVKLGSFGEAPVADFLAKVKAVAGSALRQAQ